MSGALDLDAIRARAEAATEGPWAFHDFGYGGEQEPSSIAIHTGQFDHADLREYESETAIAWMPRWEAQESDNAEFIAHAREDVPALLDEVERLRALITPRTNAVAVRADSARTKQVSEFLGDRIHKLRAQRNEARAERDRAREECGHEKRMRKLVSDQRDRFIAAKMRAEAERDRLAATLNRVRVALAGHPRCEKHAGDDPITCGWKQAVLDVQAAIEGTNS